jgi:ubiquinone/menaquinone biosynthesis C-methylase UbiE
MNARRKTGMRNSIDTWLRKDGVVFAAEIGISRGDTVLDFGCGGGDYTIPLAQCVGENGRVYGFDKDRSVLHTAVDVSRKTGMAHIMFLNGYTRIPVPNDSFDVIICYDVLHYEEKRNSIYSEFRRVVKPQGRVSIYPKHSKNDYPLMAFAEMDIETIITEIERNGFILESRGMKRIVHDSAYTRGEILNFRVE